MVYFYFLSLVAASLLVKKSYSYNNDGNSYVVETSTVFVDLEEYNAHCQAICGNNPSGVPALKAGNPPCPTCEGQMPESLVYVSYTLPGTAATPYVKTGTPDYPGGPTPVIIYTPPGSPPKAVLKTTPGTRSTPYTETKPPGKPGDPTTYLVHTPPRDITKTTPGTQSTPYTETIPPGKPGDPTTYLVHTPAKSEASSLRPKPSSSSKPAPLSSSKHAPLSSSKPAPSSSSKPTPASSTSSQCPKPTCKTGISRAAYDEPFSKDSGQKFVDSFKTDYYKSTKPPHGVSSVNGISITDSDAKDKFVSFEFRSFLYACQSGEYTFSSPSVDDIVLAWFGNKACGGDGDWTEKNYDFESNYPASKAKNFKVTLKQGDYYPVRVLYANDGGPASLSVKITGPNGEVLDGNSFVPEPCDGSNKFTDFGEEKDKGSCSKSTGYPKGQTNDG